jgi:hypothetical protein
VTAVKLEAGAYPVRALSPWYVVQSSPAEELAVDVAAEELLDVVVDEDAGLLGVVELVEVVELELCETLGCGGPAK